MAGTWNRYFSREAIAEEQVKNNLRSSTWIRPSSAEEWSNKIAELEEGVVSAKHYAANMLEIAEKS